jgi:uncharacterized membrane protein YidH (DUF202 family)
MPPEPPRRPSLANERTALGWQRSSLSLAVIAVLLLTHAVHRGEPLGVGAAALVACGSAWAALAGRRLYARRRRAPGGPAGRPLLVLAAVTVGAAALAVAELAGSR